VAKRPITFSIALGFILLNAISWLVFSILTGARLIPLGDNSSTLRWLLVVLAVLAAGVLFILYFLLRRQNRAAYFLSLVTFAGLFLLSFMDQIGILDLIYSVITLIPLVLLLICRGWYFQKQVL
jgi:hypothetical protein